MRHTTKGAVALIAITALGGAAGCGGSDNSNISPSERALLQKQLNQENQRINKAQGIPNGVTGPGSPQEVQRRQEQANRALNYLEQQSQK